MTPQAPSSANTHKMYLILLRRSKAFHRRQSRFEILQHQKLREGVPPIPPGSITQFLGILYQLVSTFSKSIKIIKITLNNNRKKEENKIGSVYHAALSFIAAAVSEPEVSERGSSLIGKKLHYRGIQSLFLTKRKELWLCATQRFGMRNGLARSCG